jgi:anthranilate synthase component 1
VTTTTREEFARQLREARVVPVIRTLFADALTPVGLYRSLAEGRTGTFLLESAEQGGIWSRYSFVGVRSFGVLTERDGAAVWIPGSLDAERAFGGTLPATTLAALDALYARWRSPENPEHPPLTGGLVGFIGWDAVRQVEHLPDAPPSDFPCPELAMAFVSELIVMDHRQGTVSLIASALGDGIDDDETLWADAQRRLDALEASTRPPRRTIARPPPSSSPRSSARRVSSATATCSRSSSASASTTRSRRARSTCIACCAPSTPRRTCTRSRSRRPMATRTRSSARRPRPS